MVSYKTYFFVKCLTAWNTVYDWCGSVKKNVSDFTSYLKDYYYDHHNTWYLLPGHSLPICASSIADKTCPFFGYHWTYSSTNNTLFHRHYSSVSSEYYKIGWLSADVVIKRDTYEVHHSMDHFLQSFAVCMNSNQLLSIHDLFQTWCIHQRRWFYHQDYPIEIHAFDQYGEMKHFRLNDGPLYLKAEGKKLIVLPDENKN